MQIIPLNLDSVLLFLHNSKLAYFRLLCAGFSCTTSLGESLVLYYFLKVLVWGEKIVVTLREVYNTGLY